jgi:hypothetical protein
MVFPFVPIAANEQNIKARIHALTSSNIPIKICNDDTLLVGQQTTIGQQE